MNDGVSSSLTIGRLDSGRKEYSGRESLLVVFYIRLNSVDVLLFSDE